MGPSQYKDAVLPVAYRDSHVKDKTVSPTVLSLTCESPYLGKTLLILRRGHGVDVWRPCLDRCIVMSCKKQRNVYICCRNELFMRSVEFVFAFIPVVASKREIKAKILLWTQKHTSPYILIYFCNFTCTRWCRCALANWFAIRFFFCVWSNRCPAINPVQIEPRALIQCKDVILPV